MFHDIPPAVLSRMRELEAIDARLVPGGLLVADNAISHEAALRPMLDFASSDERVDALIVPIGRGELVCRKR